MAWGQVLNPEQISDASKYLIAFVSNFVEEVKSGNEPVGGAANACLYSHRIEP